MLNFMALYSPNKGWKKIEIINKERKDTIMEFGKANLQPLGPMFQHL
jgi:hypothetical protein